MVFSGIDINKPSSYATEVEVTVWARFFLSTNIFFQISSTMAIVIVIVILHHYETGFSSGNKAPTTINTHPFLWREKENQLFRIHIFFDNPLGIQFNNRWYSFHSDPTALPKKYAPAASYCYRIGERPYSSGQQSSLITNLPVGRPRFLSLCHVLIVMNVVGRE